MDDKKIKKANNVIWIIFGFCAIVTLYFDYRVGGFREVGQSLLLFVIAFCGFTLLINFVKWLKKRNDNKKNGENNDEKKNE